MVISVILPCGYGYLRVVSVTFSAVVITSVQLRLLSYGCGYFHVGAVVVVTFRAVVVSSMRFQLL